METQLGALLFPDLQSVSVTIRNKVGMCGKSVNCCHEPIFSCSSLVKSKPIWLHLKELKFKAKKYFPCIAVDRTWWQRISHANCSKKASFLITFKTKTARPTWPPPPPPQDVAQQNCKQRSTFKVVFVNQNPCFQSVKPMLTYHLTKSGLEIWDNSVCNWTKLYGLIQ